MIKIYLIIILFSSLAFANKELELCIIHINDTHSHLASESYVLEFDGIKTYVDIGGVSRVASKIKSLQNSSKNTLTLNAGDTFQGTLYFTYFNGKADASMLNMIDWDAISLGNHEFDNGDNFLSSYLSMVKDSKNRVISANVIASEGDALFDKWKPYKIKEFPNGEKVGIIGIDIVDKTKNSSNPSKKIIFLDELETAQKYIDKLQSMGINKIVLLSHVGLKNDKRYASKLRGVDIIVGGDSHSLMGDFSSVALESEEMVYPYESVDANGKKVCIVQA